MERIYVTIVELQKKDSGEVLFRSSAGMFTNKKVATRDILGKLSQDGLAKTHDVGHIECFCIPAEMVRYAYEQLYPDDDDDGRDDDTAPIAPDPEDHGKPIEQAAPMMPPAFTAFIDELIIPEPIEHRG